MWSLFVFLTFGCGYNKNSLKRSDDITMALNEVRLMDSCRIKARNIEFYIHKYKAEKVIEHYKHKKDINSTQGQLLTRLRCNYTFALADYLLQVGKGSTALEEMNNLSSDYTFNIYNDTTLWLNFLNHEGKVLYLPYDEDPQKTALKRGYDCLIQGYIMSNKAGYQFHKAQTMLRLSQYLLTDSIRNLLATYDKSAIRYINEDGVSEQSLARNLAERALNIFHGYDDKYLTADAWRHNAQCYFNDGEFDKSLECLNMALAMPEIDSMPDLRATVSEQLSMTYAALNDKHLSDYYRNVYLDLQDSTRQDRQMEARVIALKDSINKIWMHVIIAIAVFLLLCAITILLWRKRKQLLEHQVTTEKLTELLERQNMLDVKLSDMTRSFIEQKARIQVVNGMLPLIDRMKIAISKDDTEYAKEIAQELETQNAMLTDWIKLKPGIVKPKIETLSLQDVFNIIKKRSPLSGDRTSLTICDTDAVVKADKTLTLFVINTLIDNARNAIRQEGDIRLSCTSAPQQGYAEVCVADTGCGMDENEASHLFDFREIKDDAGVKSHGFGLANCRGIMERYKKLSSTFSVCTISATSTKGHGTEIRFRLPLVLKTILLLFAINIMPCNASLHDVARYCDSLYHCNVDGRYEQAMLYADSCIAEVDKYPEVDKEILLSLYNETAVAALVLHQWNKYDYYNYLYTNLYKEVTRDSQLPTYCETMEHNKLTANITMLSTRITIACFIPIQWLVYYRHVVGRRKSINQQIEDYNNNIAISSKAINHLHLVTNISSNQLSTLKHETMYYPSQIKTMLNQSYNHDDLQKLVDYYRELYNVLGIQAMNNNATDITFHMSRIPIHDLSPTLQNSGLSIMANKELMNYLMLLLKRHNAGENPDATATSIDDDYICISFCMEHSTITPSQAPTVFTPSTISTDYLIMKQIIRETGNATMRYSTGILSTFTDGHFYINITLPVAQTNNNS